MARRSDIDAANPQAGGSRLRHWPVRDTLYFRAVLIVLLVLMGGTVGTWKSALAYSRPPHPGIVVSHERDIDLHAKSRTTVYVDVLLDDGRTVRVIDSLWSTTPDVGTRVQVREDDGGAAIPSPTRMYASALAFAVGCVGLGWLVVRKRRDPTFLGEDAVD